MTHPQSPASSRVAFRHAGFLLLEVVAGISFVLIALLGVGAAVVSNQRALETSTEVARKTHTFRQVAERIRSTPFHEIAYKYRDVAMDLEDDGVRARIQVLVDETDDSADARLLGLPRDLDGDGVASTLDVSSGYELLPIKITLEWQGAAGPETHSLHYCLSRES